MSLRSRNAFSGSVPPDWGLPASVTQIKCHDNALTGSLPPNFVFPPKLESWSLDQNRIVGTIPPQWGASLPATMTELWLWNNGLSGKPASSGPSPHAVPHGAPAPCFCVPPCRHAWRPRRLGASRAPKPCPLPAVRKPFLEQYHELPPATRKSWRSGGAAYYMSLSLPLSPLPSAAAGTLPYWPGRSQLQVMLHPGNPNLCGPTPASPVYIDYNPTEGVSSPLVPLPDCDQQQLLGFKASFENGAQVLASWNASTGGPCNGTAWLGVSCSSAGEVVGM